MIETTLTQERADELLARGIHTITDPRNSHRADQVFFFTGPALSLAQIAWGELKAGDSLIDLHDQSVWECAVLHLPPKTEFP